MNRLFDTDNWKEILSALMRNKTRSFLTGFGIFWGVMMLVLLWSGGSGVIATVGQQFEGMSTNVAYLLALRTNENYKGFSKGRTWNMTLTDVASIENNVEGVRRAVPICQSYGKTIVAGNKSRSATVVGIAHGQYELERVVVEQGRTINDLDIRANAKVVAIGKRVAENLWPSGEPLGKTVTIGGNSFTVVGVINDFNQNVQIGGKVSESVHMALPLYQSTFHYFNNVHGVMVEMKPGVKLADITPSIEKCVFTPHSISPTDHGALYIIDFAKYFNMAQNILWGVRLLAIIVGAGMLFAGLIGVSNIMMVILKERTNEIGIRRAIGARPRDILTQFLCESTLLTLVAGMCGMMVAVGITAVLQLASGKPFVLSFGEAMTITMIFVALGIAAGIMPARRAMTIKPIEAMNEK